MKLSGVGVRRLLLARADDDVDKSSVVNDALARSSLWAFLRFLFGNYCAVRERKRKLCESHDIIKEHGWDESGKSESK